jgi:hypothetical protein
MTAVRMVWAAGVVELLALGADPNAAPPRAIAWQDSPRTYILAHRSPLARALVNLQNEWRVDGRAACAIVRALLASPRLDPWLMDAQLHCCMRDFATCCEWMARARAFAARISDGSVRVDERGSVQSAGAASPPPLPDFQEPHPPMVFLLTPFAFAMRAFERRLGLSFREHAALVQLLQAMARSGRPFVGAACAVAVPGGSWRVFSPLSSLVLLTTRWRCASVAEACLDAGADPAAAHHALRRLHTQSTIGDGCAVGVHLANAFLTSIVSGHLRRDPVEDGPTLREAAGEEDPPSRDGYEVRPSLVARLVPVPAELALLLRAALAHVDTVSTDQFRLTRRPTLAAVRALVVSILREHAAQRRAPLVRMRRCMRHEQDAEVCEAWARLCAEACVDEGGH